jgi:hypothetical protein
MTYARIWRESGRSLRSAETCTAQMSEVYREKGEKLYLPEG